MFNENMYRIILFETRVSKNKAKEILGYNSNTLIRHLFYVFFENSNSSLDDWCEEIYYYYDELPELRSKRKKLSKLDIKKSIFDLSDKKFHLVFIKNIKNINRKFNRQYSYNTKDLESKVYSFISKYIDWLSEQLYEDNPFSIDDTQNKLMDLYNEYKF